MQIDGNYRQAANRAFAAEFLTPIAAIKAMKDDGWTDDKIAPEFGVADEVVRLQPTSHAVKPLTTNQRPKQTAASGPAALRLSQMGGR